MKTISPQTTHTLSDFQHSLAGRPGDDFWQFNALAGYRFASNRCDGEAASPDLLPASFGIGGLDAGFPGGRRSASPFGRNASHTPAAIARAFVSDLGKSVWL